MRKVFLGVAFLVMACSTSGTVVEQEVTGSKDAVDARGTDNVAELDVPVAETWDFGPGTDLAADLGLDVGPACAPGAGCFLDPCLDNEECLSGWCVESMGEGVCSQHCEMECPAGWSCKQVAGTDPDVVFICVSDFANLCKPCASAEGCQGAGGTQAACLDFGPGKGSFCGGGCAEDADCPAGFLCEDATTVDGSVLKQCRPASGECACSQKSIELALSTPCTQGSSWGTCEGQRVCGPDGLSPCSAGIPTQENCNGIDDDCDGEVDEPDLLDGEYVSLCDDGNACTEDHCYGEDGCEHSASTLNGSDCDDGESCTEEDTCHSGVCLGETIVCDDDNLCTDDACVDGVCEFVPNADDCDDGDPCTVADECGDGECAGTPVNCDCQENADCGALEDGDLCNGTLFCDTTKLPYKCAVVPDSEVDCPQPEGLDAPCLAASCDPLSGACSFVPANDGGACEDGNACTIGDTCVEGTCTGGAAANCADDNPCTDDSCDSDLGCQHVNNTVACNDGNTCTTGDTCADGVCVGGPALPCDDQNPCTADDCVAAAGCVHIPLTSACDDGNACTQGDVCSGGSCVAGAAIVCGDGNLCTDDACDPADGCVYTFNASPCSDGSVCTTDDVCQDGTCAGGPELTCNDNNPCTDDSCDPLAGCQFAANEASCDDGNACTTGDTCQAGACKAGALLQCNDGNVCTDDSCDLLNGCVYATNTLPCNDLDACTATDTCSLGECVGDAIVCDDGNFCTDDSCDQNLGCQFVANAVQCDDANACTESDQCSEGTCQGQAVVCDDANPCTVDGCDAEAGCQAVAVDDDTPCVLQGLCVGACAEGTCVETAVEVCDGQDNDCDDEVDEGFDDTDNDGKADCVDGDDDGDGVVDEVDCEPLNAAVFPGNEEVCDNDVDDDCDPTTPDLCALASCKAILAAGQSTGSGNYFIDPDGQGGTDPFQVYCDMDFDGGGWTRFNWVLQKYPNGADPLGQALSECAVDGTICRARIPSNETPADLLVKDKTQNQYAAWHFNGSTISNAVLAALRDKTQSCLYNVGAFQPYSQNSSESYCGNGGEGGCDSFYYTSGSCKAAGNWGIHWDGDNHWCAAAFKMGATVAGGCGYDDQGFLNDCDCDDEHGELYYR